MREVTDTDRPLTDRDTAEMRDFKRIALQCFSEVGVQTLEINSGRRRKVLKIIETFKRRKISTLHREVKHRRIPAPRMLAMMFVDWHNFINNEDI